MIISPPHRLLEHDAYVYRAVAGASPTAKPQRRNDNLGNIDRPRMYYVQLEGEDLNIPGRGFSLRASAWAAGGRAERQNFRPQQLGEARCPNDHHQ
jgi:hypothetical protein